MSVNVLLLEAQALKAKLRVFLTDCTVPMVTCYIKYNTEFLYQ